MTHPHSIQHAAVMLVLLGLGHSCSPAADPQKPANSGNVAPNPTNKPNDKTTDPKGPATPASSPAAAPQKSTAEDLSPIRSALAQEDRNILKSLESKRRAALIREALELTAAKRGVALEKLDVQDWEQAAKLVEESLQGPTSEASKPPTTPAADSSAGGQPVKETPATGAAPASPASAPKAALAPTPPEQELPDLTERQSEEILKKLGAWNCYMQKEAKSAPLAERRSLLQQVAYEEISDLRAVGVRFRLKAKDIKRGRDLADKVLKTPTKAGSNSPVEKKVGAETPKKKVETDSPDLLPPSDQSAPSHDSEPAKKK
jgi:hypothetical protein